ncbi:MAG: Ig-like domain-containing protein, partial [Muribaculaceae bacterium]|nr:Ig-like domain-containing protein [Muribaculaceae bacterium]
EFSASCQVTVKPVTASDITLNVSEMTLLVGDTDKLTATVEPANTTDATITWKSDNEAVATVSADGLVTAVSVGTAIIKVSCGEVFAECKVTVTGYSGVSTLFGDENTKFEVYTLQGFKLKVENQEDLKRLAPGFYIINGKKIYLK